MIRAPAVNAGVILSRFAFMETKYHHNNNFFGGLMALVLISFNFPSCAQSKNLVKKVYAFYVERPPGNIPSIPSLIRTDTINTIYLETTTRLINWDTATRRNVAYLIKAVLLDQSAFEVGRIKATNEKIIITPAKGLFLWQLWLEPIEPVLEVPGTQKSAQTEIILKGEYKGKRLVQKVGKIIELAGIPSV